MHANKQDQYFEDEGIRIRYRDIASESNSDTAILFSHGVGASLETWDSVIDGLGNSYRTVTWDYPGHGLTDNTDIEYTPGNFSKIACKLLDHLGIKSVILVGNSFGGAVSLRIADAKESMVKGVACLNAATLGKDNPFVFRLSILPLLPSLLFKPGKLAIDNQIKSIFFNPEALSEECKKIIERNVMRPGNQAGFIKAIQSITTLAGQKPETVKKSHDIVRALSIPMVFFHGREDAVIPYQHSENVHKLAKDSELVLLDNCGHTPQIEEPERVVAGIIDLAKKI